MHPVPLIFDAGNGKTVVIRAWKAGRYSASPPTRWPLLIAATRLTFNYGDARVLDLSFDLSFSPLGIEETNKHKEGIRSCGDTW